MMGEGFDAMEMRCESLVAVGFVAPRLYLARRVVGVLMLRKLVLRVIIRGQLSLIAMVDGAQQNCFAARHLGQSVAAVDANEIGTHDSLNRSPRTRSQRSDATLF